MAESTMSCPKCGEQASPDASFCEACGARLSHSRLVDQPKRDGCRCGAPADSFDADGFCQQCGRKREIADPRDHLEGELSADFAAVTDRGIRHKRNEDDFFISLHASGAVLVVADGVSSASNSNIASRTACRTAQEELIRAFEANEALETASRQAILRAHRSVLRVPMGDDGRPEPPGTTIVAAVVRGSQITVAWAGDSRAYWLGETQCLQLTKDHSWLTEIVESGQMTEAKAEKDSRAHAITQCIGALNDEAPEPSVIQFTITEPGYFLVCTDGLWGYVKSPNELKAMLTEQTTLGCARKLVDFAIQKGGVDNITAALLRISTPT